MAPIANVTANAAIDMFLDLDDSKSRTFGAKYEVMLWFGTFGYAQPFGSSTNIQHIVPVQQGQNATL
jgi:hypothetical protein